ncbi:hypothetical protein JHK87_010490 [Glycine soja]|nr:hypothetical protein JHK87_010490 [Glycine soja]
MEFRCLSLLFFLNVILVITAHAAIPPEVYRERMLPNTPMPKAIIEFLNLERLRPGSKLDAHFNKGENVIPLLPREIAQHILFSSTKIKEIVEMLFVKPELENVEMVSNTTAHFMPLEGENGTRVKAAAMDSQAWESKSYAI